MGCGCKGKKGTTVRRVSLPGGGSKLIRPTVGPAVTGNVANGASPAQIRALNLANNVVQTNPARIDADRRRIEKLRREAVRRSLNK